MTDLPGLNEDGDPIMWQRRVGGVYAEVSGNKNSGYPVYTAIVRALPELSDIEFEHASSSLGDGILAARSALVGYLAGIGYSAEEIKMDVPQ
jgi:hypothetical protein